MAKELNEDTGFNISIKTLIGISEIFKASLISSNGGVRPPTE